MNESVEVRLSDRSEPCVVGRLLDVGQGPHFEYDPSFLREGVELSPVTLARGPRVFAPGPPGLHRLRGLFFDSLPDGWGLRLLHQAMRGAGVDPVGNSSVVWLRALGTRGMGALTYHPAPDFRDSSGGVADLEALAANARKVDAGDVEEILPALQRAGGTSGGARPKIVVAWHRSGTIADAFSPLPKGYRHVLLKFASSREPADAPAVEATYLTLARRAGIEVPGHEVRTLRSGHLALIVDRFDRVEDTRRHVHTLAGLAEIDIRSDDLCDYRSLLAAAFKLSNDMREVRAAWLRAAFNVAACNRDDHARNVAFLMNPEGRWRLAPAYDLTYSTGPGGYHTMSVAGEGANPGRDDLLRLAADADLSRADALRMLDQVRHATSSWKAEASASGVSAARIREIGRRLAGQSALLAPAATKPRSRTRQP